MQQLAAQIQSQRLLVITSESTQRHQPSNTSNCQVKPASALHHHDTRGPLGEGM
jgi:hypothetical protein